MHTPKIIILRGLPGSGKTTFVEYVKRRARGMVAHITADSWPELYGEDGKIVFEQLQTAHDSAYSVFDAEVTEMEDPCEFVIVDNTMTRLWEMQHYIACARLNAIYDVTVIELRFPHDPETIAALAARSKRKVPKWKVQKMADRWESIPAFWPVENHVIERNRFSDGFRHPIFKKLFEDCDY